MKKLLNHKDFSSLLKLGMPYETYITIDNVCSWLRKDLFINICGHYNAGLEKPWSCWIQQITENPEKDTVIYDYDSYEEALIEGIHYVIKNNLI